jgi:hypothetical protein
MSPTTKAPSADPTLTGARRVAIVFVIVSLSLAALVGIATLLTGEFGELQGKVMLTTLLTAGFAITSLCHLAVVGRSLRVVGFAGIGASALALIAGAVLVWRPWDNWSEGWESTLKAFAVLGITAASLAQANLLLLLAGRRKSVVRIGVFVTVGLIALLALLLFPPIITEGEIPGDNGDAYWRFVGVVAILDVLGTIVIPVLGRVYRDGPRAITVRLTGEAAGVLAAVSAERGVSAETVVAELVASLEPPHAGPPAE